MKPTKAITLAPYTSIETAGTTKATHRGADDAGPVSALAFERGVALHLDVALMQEIQSSTTGEPLPISLGWFVVDDPEHRHVEHAGGGPGVRTLMRLYPDDGLGIVLMSNAAEYDDLLVMEAAANVVYTVMAGQ